MNGYVALVVFLGFTLLQSSLMPYASLGFSRPFLPLLAAVSWGLFTSPLGAFRWALGLGLLLDALSPEPFGFYLVPLLAGAVVGSQFGRRFFGSNALLPPAAAAVATLCFMITQRLLLTASGTPLTWDLRALAEESLPAILLNWLWLPLVYFPLGRVARAVGPPRIEWDSR